MFIIYNFTIDSVSCISAHYDDKWNKKIESSNEHIKRHSMSYIIGELQIKAIMGYQYFYSNW